MQFQAIDWKKGIILGAVAGIAWGWIAMTVNAISGAFPFESSLVHNLTIFAMGGAIFGIIVSGFLSLLKEWLPFRNIFLKTILLSTALWLILRIGGIILSSINPDRYHPNMPQTIQGFILAVIMGGLLGFLWKIKSKEA